MRWWREARAVTAGERGRAVVWAVVGDDAHDPGDAVGGEERPGAAEEPDGGRGGLVGQVSV